ncbi:MAG TPA: uroporphyrinogen-III synthase [Gammaproteobacteria bacterium]|nr:uroporphyrinogen-III synthase [Gammaproteobacteria bacterium]
MNAAKPLPLRGRTIALPEKRELDLFARMLEERGATTLRCPLISIHDAPDAAPVNAWLERFNAGGMDDLILLTGEGLRRLLGFAERLGAKEAFVERLARVRTITRGPKPARELRKLGLKPALSATAPTTAGVIEALRQDDLRSRRIGVQCYGSDPNPALMTFLSEAGAQCDPVAPYVYASEAEDRQVIHLIEALGAGNIDVIAFTSGPQVKRVWQLAQEAGLQDALASGMARTRVAAVGPVVARALESRGVTVAMMPQSSFFMKPLVKAIVAALARD